MGVLYVEPRKGVLIGVVADRLRVASLTGLLGLGELDDIGSECLEISGL